jgi:YVTN family beta-propeller protein
MPGGTHGVVSANALGKGFTDDGKAGEAIAFDLKTLKITDRIRAEPDADGMGYDPASGHVLVVDGDSAKVTVIDAASDRVVATVDAGGKLEFGVAGGNGKFFVNGEERGEIVRIDLATNRADAHWPMPGCKSPHGLAIDQAHLRLFSTCANRIMTVLDATNGTVLATLPIGEGTDAAGFDSTRGLAFSSNRDGTLSVIAEKSPTSFVALPPVATEMGARTMAVDSGTGRIFLVTAEMTENAAVPAGDPRHRFTVKPGTVKLLFLDPSASGAASGR